MAELGGVADADASGLGVDPPFAGPSAHDADGGLDGGPGHVGEVLAGEGPPEENLAVPLLAELLGHPQEDRRKPGLRARRRQPKSGGPGLEKAAHHHVEGAHGEVGMAPRDVPEPRAVDSQADGGLERLGGGGHRNSLQDGDRRDELPGAEDVEDEILAIERLLGNLQATAHQAVDGVTRIALSKKISSTRWCHLPSFHLPSTARSPRRS